MLFIVSSIKTGAGFSWSAIGGTVLAGLGAITPVGWVVIGGTAVAAVGVGIYYAAEHTKNKRKSTSDKHTKPRSGRSNTKNRQKPNWEPRNPKKPK